MVNRQTKKAAWNFFGGTKHLQIQQVRVRVPFKSGGMLAIETWQSLRALWRTNHRQRQTPVPTESARLSSSPLGMRAEDLMQHRLFDL
jgi:hypothetical protein